MICDSVFLIPTTIKGKRSLVYYNLKNKIEENKKGVTNLLCISKGVLYGWMDMDSYISCSDKSIIPSDIVAFMRNGGRVLLCSP